MRPAPAEVTSLTATAGTVIKATPGELVAVLITSQGAASEIYVYDNAAAASGTILADVKTPAINATMAWQPAIPLRAKNGLYAVVTGAAAVAVVAYH